MNLSEVIKNAKEIKKENYKLIMQLCVRLLSISMICALASFFFNYVAILLVPFVVVPLIMCTFDGAQRLIKKDEYNFNQYYRVFRRGMNPLVWKILELFKSYLKMILVIIISFFLGLFILWLIPAYRNIMEQLISIIFTINLGTMTNDLNAFLNANSNIIENPLLIVSVVSEAVGILYFILKLLSNLLKISGGEAQAFAFMTRAPQVEKVIKDNKRKYRLGYIKFNWYGFPIMIISFAAGLISMIIINKTQLGGLIATICMCFALILILPNLIIYNYAVVDNLKESLSEAAIQGVSIKLQELLKTNPQLIDKVEELKRTLDVKNESSITDKIEEDNDDNLM